MILTASRFARRATRRIRLRAHLLRREFNLGLARDAFATGVYRGGLLVAGRDVQAPDKIAPRRSDVVV